MTEEQVIEIAKLAGFGKDSTLKIICVNDFFIENPKYELLLRFAKALEDKLLEERWED